MPDRWSIILSIARSDHGAPPMVEIGGRHCTIAIRTHPRSRHMRLRTDPARDLILVTMPVYARHSEALAFVRKQADWIADSFARAGQPVTLQPDSEVMIHGLPHRIVWNEGASRRVVRSDGLLRLGGPREMVAARLLRWIKAEARRSFAEDAAHYCARAGEAPVRLALSSASRRWGSCSRDRSLRLNWRLVMAPPWVRQSVVAHEIAHLRHMDHSAAFYAWLDRIYDGNRKAADRWLKDHGRTLHMIVGG